MASSKSPADLAAVFPRLVQKVLHPKQLQPKHNLRRPHTTGRVCKNGREGCPGSSHREDAGRYSMKFAFLLCERDMML